MKKRLFSFIMIISLISSLFSTPAFAEDTTSGFINNYTSWTFNLNTGHLDIIVTEDGDILQAGISYDTTLREQIKSINITGNVKIIDSDALKWLKNVETISLPDSITEIKDYAFYDCNSLKEINLPKNLKTIGESAFSNCYNLESVVFSSGIEKIDAYAFSNCTSLKSIYLSETVSSIGDYAFNYCSLLESIQVNNNNLYFYTEDNILYDKSKTSILKYASGKPDTSFSIPSSVKTIDVVAFDCCYNLETITMSDNVTMINAYAFADCTALTDIKLSNNLLYIGNGAFSRCSSLESVTLPPNITTIPEYAFASCSALTTVKKGENLSRVENGAFDRCSSLSDFDFSNITSIGDYAFHSSNLTSIRFDDSLISIGTYAFDWCKKLSDVTFPDSLSHIGKYAFYACPLTEVKLGNNIATINEGTFAGCDIEKFTIGSALVNVDNYAFYGNSFTEINLGPNIKTIGNEAFLSCWDLTTVSLGKKLISVGTDAFYQTKLSYVNYEGSKEEWSKVVVKSGNSKLLNAAFTFNYLPIGFVDYKPPFSSDPSNPIGVSFSSGKGEAKIHYSDEFFAQSSYSYKHDLAKASIRLAVSAFATGVSKGEFSTQYTNVKNLLTAINFEDISYNDWYTKEPERNSIAVISGKKHIKYPDGDYTLIAVAVRGGNYINEWGGNFRVGTNDLHEGFTIARDQVIDHIKKYIHDKKIYGKVKIWITGYSRAAATTNLTAAYLDENPHILSDNITLSPEDIYAYCFETPMGVVNPDNQSGLYNNIYSIVNLHDFVPMVAMRKWGYDRYGITKYLPSRYTHGSEYDNLLEKLVEKFEEYNKNAYTIDTAVYPGYPSGQNGFLENLMNILATTVGSAENYTAEYQETFEWVGEELLGKKDPEEFLNTFIKKLKEKKVLLTVESSGILLNPILPWNTAPSSTGALYLTLRSVIVETFAELGISVSPSVVDTLVQIVLKVGVQDILTLKNNVDSLKQGHEPTLCMAWLDVIDESDFVSNNVRTLKLTCPLPTSIYDKERNLVAQYNAKARTTSPTTLYSYIDDDGSIVVYLPGNQEYSVEISATEDAEVSYSIHEVNASTGNANITTYKASLSKDDTLTGTIENLEEEKGSYALSLNEQQLAATNKLDNAELITVITSTVGNGNVTPAKNCYPGELVTVTATPIEGETFIGWHNDYYELVSKEEAYTFTPYDNTTLIAEFSENTCEVLFTDGENTIETKRIQKGSNVKFPSAPEKDWYTFENYYKDQDFLEIATESDTIYGNTILYAKYVSDFSYSVNYKNEASVTGYNGDKKHIIIPSDIDGYPVTQIHSSAQFSDKIESITFPATITSIDYPPFEGCASLKEFAVDTNNEYYYAQDGVLIDKSTSSILCYPKGKTDISYTIPESVTIISNISNLHLKELILHENMQDISWHPLKNSGVEIIFYTGSQESFNNVLNAYEEPNGVLDNAKVYYNYNGTPISARLTCTYENSQLQGEISYNYVLKNCVAYITVYDSKNKLIKFAKAGEVAKDQTEATHINLSCPNPGNGGYAKILFLTDLSTLKPAGMWTAADIYKF